MTKGKGVVNFIESRKYVKFFKLIFGVSVFTPECDQDGKVKSKFNILGFTSFLLWGAVYYYSLFTVINKDYTILRNLYNTKLNHYGDAVEIIATTALVLYGTWKAPFDLSGNIKCVQCIVDIDKAIEDLGERTNFKQDVNKFLLLPLIKILITTSRVISTYNLKLDSIPITKMLQLLTSDYIAFVLTAHFCFYLYVIRIRYEIINKVLEQMKEKESREFVIIRVQKHTNNGMHIQDIYLREKLKKCGKICSMLNNTSIVVNEKFGFAIVCTMAVCLAMIILYLYYFMEATASGLFHDPTRYINFMVYVLWVIFYALFLIFLSIYYSESAIEAAKMTSRRAHDIINSDMDQTITREAANLSLQMLHQTPVFSGCGLTDFNYALLLEGTKSVVTFLVIMLQFIADNHIT